MMMILQYIAIGVAACLGSAAVSVARYKWSTRHERRERRERLDRFFKEMER